MSLGGRFPIDVETRSRGVLLLGIGFGNSALKGRNMRVSGVQGCHPRPGLVDVRHLHSIHLFAASIQRDTTGRSTGLYKPDAATVKRARFSALLRL